MNAVSPQALRANADLLRYVGAHPEALLADLATALGRDRSNLVKTLATLEKQGLLQADAEIRLTDAGRAALADLPPGTDPFRDQMRRAADETDAEAAHGVRGLAEAGFALIPHALIQPDLLNPRRAFDDEALDALAASIAADGLLQNLVVRPAAPLEGFGQPMHRLVSGERRWRAINRLILAGEWPADRPLPCQIKAVDDAGHAVLAILENLQRVDLNPLEEARGFKRLVDDFGFKTVEIARRINGSQRLVQQRLQLLELPDAYQQQMADGRLSVDQARQVLANRPKPIDLSDAEKLLFLEICHHVASQPQEHGAPAFYSEAPIGAVGDDGGAERLETLRLITFRSDWDTAVEEVALQYDSRRAFEVLTGGDTLEVAAIDPALREWRKVAIAAAGPEDVGSMLGALEAGRYLTPWLNPPWAEDPARKAEKEAFARRQAEADEASKARKAKVAGFKDAARALERGLKKADFTTADGQLQAAIEGLDIALPLRFKNNLIEDGNGRTVATTPYLGVAEEVRAPLLRLIALAVNASLGFAKSTQAVADAANDAQSEALDPGGDEDGDVDGDDEFAGGDEGDE